jgi:hypothetical protein
MILINYLKISIREFNSWMHQVVQVNNDKSKSENLRSITGLLFLSLNYRIKKAVKKPLFH